ncbi:MetQ/NlpA family ABC transporter substrate-binding protein [Marinitenerispora sediminis]|uniref:Lipoprotein n=1 Tax=Marinitenerispora sediminis TaxID=1931232 RepID=A0A368T115_9ACTN|nr:MetQ/NlpA family ABC transporter substrate-binding protein [Marinitenerispora sediminis]RCV50238.1 metal ABC transporter substrate-binding protein [Marinitenerispora sediminis]RCV53509.1 metal ABC transporter substrate-binding protein [Marinitenerispora sediminis]RCV54577.1 metal ABC transporter substrate-binding protein [Marinitenerispora sediminis]
MRKIWAIIGATTLATSLAACGSPSENAAEGDSDNGDLATLRVGVNPVPHGDILRFVQENLAADAGLDLQIVEIADYNQPNPQLVAGELDANYFQHRTFLGEWQDANPDDQLVYVSDVHVERLGLYSSEYENVDDLPDGAEIAVPNDAANLDRALRTLEAEGLLTVDPDAGALATENDIQDNPKDITVTPLEAAQLPRSLGDVDAAVVNGNYAIEADLAANDNVLAWEPDSAEDYVENYANGLVVRAEDEDDPGVAQLAELLHSDEVRQYIEDTWQGVVYPVDEQG